MRKIIALTLACLLMAAALAEASTDLKLTATINGARLTSQWAGETSEEYDWLVVELGLTNWHVDTRNISAQVSGRLVYRNMYAFDAKPVFNGDSIAPLVEKQGALEGPGFDTPEDAVLAYLNGLNDGDVSAMLSTFAIESFVNHTDPEAFLCRAGAFMSSMINGMPLYGDYARSVMTHARYGSIANMLSNHYIELSTGLNGTVYAIKDFGMLQELLGKFMNSPVNGWQGHVDFVQWIEPAALSENFLNARNIQNIARQMACAGADDYKILAAHIRLNGVDALQTMGCVKYGDRWYNCDLVSNLSTLLSVQANCAGMIYPDASGDVDIPSALNALTIDPKTAAMIEAWENSDMKGTIWRLVATNIPDIAVLDSAVGTAGDTGRSACAEVKFGNHGCVTADIRLSPALAAALTDGYSDLKAAGVWFDVGGKPEIGLIQEIKTQTAFDSATCLRDGDTIVLRLSDGTEFTLQRVDE